jgi:hypothetical protein
VLGLGWRGATPAGFARCVTGRSREGDGELGIVETGADSQAPLDRERGRDQAAGMWAGRSMGWIG